MLRNDLYRILSLEAAESGFAAGVELLPDSPVYAAHFKGMPVTPGACLVEMACELASAATGRVLDVASAPDIRFLHPVLPDQTRTLQFLLEAGESGAWNIRILDGETLCAKLKLILE